MRVMTTILSISLVCVMVSVAPAEPGGCTFCNASGTACTTCGDCIIGGGCTAICGPHYIGCDVNCSLPIGCRLRNGSCVNAVPQCCAAIGGIVSPCDLSPAEEEVGDEAPTCPADQSAVASETNTDKPDSGPASSAKIQQEYCCPDGTCRLYWEAFPGCTKISDCIFCMWNAQDEETDQAEPATSDTVGDDDPCEEDG